MCAAGRQCHKLHCGKSCGIWGQRVWWKQRSPLQPRHNTVVVAHRSGDACMDGLQCCEHVALNVYVWENVFEKYPDIIYVVSDTLYKRHRSNIILHVLVFTYLQQKRHNCNIYSSDIPRPSLLHYVYRVVCQTDGTTYLNLWHANKYGTCWTTVYYTKAIDTWWGRYSYEKWRYVPAGVPPWLRDGLHTTIRTRDTVFNRRVDGIPKQRLVW